MNIEGREAVFIDTGESLTVIRLCDDHVVVLDSDSMLRVADYGTFKLTPEVVIPVPEALRNVRGIKHVRKPTAPKPSSPIKRTPAPENWLTRWVFGPIPPNSVGGM